MAKQVTNETFISLLVREVPELVPLYENHLRDNLDELLPTVFMGEVTRFVVDAYYRSSSATGDPQYWSGVSGRIMHMVERAAASADWELGNLVTVSFCESLLDLEEDDAAAYWGIRNKMGPKLAEKMDIVREYWNRRENG